MKIKMIKSGATLDVNASYGARLIEQGIAVIAPAAMKKTAKKEPPKGGEDSGS